MKRKVFAFILAVCMVLETPLYALATDVSGGLDTLSGTGISEDATVAETESNTSTSNSEESTTRSEATDESGSSIEEGSEVSPKVEAGLKEDDEAQSDAESDIDGDAESDIDGDAVPDISGDTESDIGGNTVPTPSASTSYVSNNVTQNLTLLSSEITNARVIAQSRGRKILTDPISTTIMSGLISKPTPSRNGLIPRSILRKEPTKTRSIIINWSDAIRAFRSKAFWTILNLSAITAWITKWLLMV